MGHDSLEEVQQRDQGDESWRQMPARTVGNPPISFKPWAQMQMNSNAMTSDSTPYTAHLVNRDFIMQWSKGKEVYELVDQYTHYHIMQSVSTAIDKTLKMEDLPNLGSRLKLPDGWIYRTRVLDADLRVEGIDGVVEVMTDDFGNAYVRLDGQPKPVIDPETSGSTSSSHRRRLTTMTMGTALVLAAAFLQNYVR